MKQTAFTEIHRRLGGKMVEFAGFEMPVQYTGIVEEHQRVRTSVGIFDVSHMGEVEIHGKDALAFVQRITINDASRLKPGRVQYSAMCYEHGGIVDDLLVYNMDGHYMLVINAANTAKDLEWMHRHASGDMRIVDVSDRTSLLAVQGPRSLETLRKLTRVNLETIQYYHYVRGEVAGVPAVISRTGYTGELGFEIYFGSERAVGETMWDALMEAGKPFGIGPAGLGARDTLRMEMGYCLYGHDIDQTTNPIAAGLGWITKVDKGSFIGRDPIAAMAQKGPKDKLVGFTSPDRLVPRQGYTIRAGNAPAGTVTSGTFSPSLQQSIGMGYVDAARATPGTPLTVLVRDREVPVTVSTLPFLKK